MDIKTLKFGVIGLGQMGSGIAANMLRAGYDVCGYDLRPGALERLVAAGGRAAENNTALVKDVDVIITCVEGKQAIRLSDTVILPNFHIGQVHIEHSTVPVPQAQRIGWLMTREGGHYVDAPISGGLEGAAQGTLKIFIGGRKFVVDIFWPLFEAIGDPEKLIHCGGIGMGQAAKVVQQLTRRLPDVARMEVMAFGLRAGLDLETVWRTLNVFPAAAKDYRKLYEAIKSGETNHLAGLFPEWEYYLETAHAFGFRMPMLEGMYDFCKHAELVTHDAVHRPSPSIWNELMRRT